MLISFLHWFVVTTVFRSFESRVNTNTRLFPWNWFNFMLYPLLGCNAYAEMIRRLSFFMIDRTVLFSMLFEIVLFIFFYLFKLAFRLLGCGILLD